jgi:hypothetical protein
VAKQLGTLTSLLDLKQYDSSRVLVDGHMANLYSETHHQAGRKLEAAYTKHEQY